MLAPRDKLWSAPDPVVARALSLLSLNESDTLADYGCGDGPALLFAAREYNCKCVGYEIHAERAAKLQDIVGKDPNLASKIRVLQGNALEAKHDDGVTAVYLYLIERGLQLILPLLRRLSERAGGTLRVVTVLYSFPGLPPVRTERVTVSELVRTPIYLYHITPTSGLQATDTSSKS